LEKSTILLNEAPAVCKKGSEKEYSPLFIVVDEPPLSKGPILKLKILSNIPAVGHYWIFYYRCHY